MGGTCCAIRAEKSFKRYYWMTDSQAEYVINTFDQVIENAAGDRFQLVVAYAMLAEAYVSTSHHAKAQGCLKKAQEYAKELNDTVMQAECYCTETALHLRYGNISDAQKSGEQAIAIAEALEDVKIGLYAKSLLSASLAHEDQERAMALGQQAMEQAKTIAIPVLQLDVEINFGKVLEAQDKLKAATHLQQTAQNAADKGLKLYQAIALNFLGDVYEDMGEYHKAMKAYNESLLLSEQCDSQFLEAENLWGLANCYEEGHLNNPATALGYHKALIALHKGKPMERYEEIVADLEARIRDHSLKRAASLTA